MKRTGGEIVVHHLEKMGVPYILGIPGHGCLGLFDAIRLASERGTLKYLQVKHEQAATHIADGYYRVKGEPLAVFASIGPGSMNTAVGLATCYVDSTALLVFAGDTHVHMKGAGVLQEIERYQDSNVASVFEPLAKRVWRVESARQLERIMERAANQARDGRPGPVVVLLPMDVQAESVEVRDAVEPRRAESRPAPRKECVDKAAALLGGAKRPMIVLGGGALRARIADKLVRLAEAYGAGVVTTMAGKSAFPENHPLYCLHTGSKGTPVGLHFCRTADVVLGLGTRFADETTCSYRKGASFDFPDCKLIHVDVDPAEIGKNYSCDVGIVSDLELAVDGLLAAAGGGPDSGAFAESAYAGEMASRKAEWRSYLEEIRGGDYGGITISQLIGRLNAVLPKDAMLVTSSGNTQAQLFQEYVFEQPYRHLTTGGFSTMGWAVPAAIGAKLAEPRTPVVAVLGDGDFMMIMQELSTIAQYDIPVVIVLANNMGWLAIQDLQCDMLGVDKAFGNLWLKDGKSYSPDFVAAAGAFGIEALRVERPEDLDKAITGAVGMNKPVLVEVMVSQRYPESGGKAFGWWDVPIPGYMAEKRRKYEEEMRGETV